MEISLPENPNHYIMIIGILGIVTAIADAFYNKSIFTIFFWFFLICGVIVFMIGFARLKRDYDIKRIIPKSKNNY